METISRHELVPFTALMNMIKFNYLKKREVFHTLLGILGDYDPTDEENKKRTTKYIELLLTDQRELAEYLLSFLPNGMCVDHIGMSENEEKSLKLNKKKIVKVYKSIPISQTEKSNDTTSLQTIKQQTELNKSIQSDCVTSKPFNSKNSVETSVTTNLPVTTPQNKPAESKHMIKSVNEVQNSQVEIDQKEKTTESHVLPTPTSNLQTNSNDHSSVMSCINHAPVCSVIPSIKAHNSTGLQRDINCNVNPIYSTRSQFGDCVGSSREAIQHGLQSYQNVLLTQNANFINLSSKPIRCHPHEISYDDHNINMFSRNNQLHQQQKSSIPSLQFSFHPVSKSNTSFVRSPQVSYTDVYPVMNERLQQHPNQYPITRTLSSFPYQQQFIFSGGNTHLNHAFVPTSGIEHSNTGICHKNVQNVVTFQSRLHENNHAFFIQNQPRSMYSKQSTQNSKTTHTVTHSTETRSYSLGAQDIDILYEEKPLFNTPCPQLSTTEIPDIVTPEQDSEDLVMSKDITEHMEGKTKPRKLSMSANSAVRKKLKLTPNNHILPM